MKIFTLLGMILLFSCNNTEEKTIIQEPEISVLDVIEDQTNNFSEIRFDNPIHLELLKELDICEMTASDSSLVATCSPENFKIIEFRSDKDVKDAFILQIKAGIQFKGQDLPLPVRHLIVFERENGQLVRVNGFRGDLIANTDGEGSAKDLLIALYLNSDETLFHCLFKWEDGHYSFESVEGLDYGDGIRTLQPELKDSLSNQIYNDLMNGNLIF